MRPRRDLGRKDNKMLTKIDGYLCKLYGRDDTSLRLTGKAEQYYGESFYAIWEREADLEEDGSIIDSVTVYVVTGSDRRPMTGWMTEEETNAYLEDLADEDAAQLAEDYYWTAESWGDQIPPENAIDLIEQANAKILAFAQTRTWKDAWDIEEYANRLWDTYCTTGKI